jgi:L-malate glycosyltransferase
VRLVFLGDTCAEHLRRWATSFARLGHETHVVTWSPVVLDGYESVAVHQMTKTFPGTDPLSRAGNLVFLRARFRRLIRRLQPDLIHAHDAGSYSWLAMFSGFHPFVVTPWGSDILTHIHRSVLTHYFTAKSLRRADWVQAEGEDTRQAVLGFGVQPDKIVVLPLGVDLVKFSPGASPPGFLERHGLVGSPIVVSTRTPNPVHDVASTLRAAAIVLKSIPAMKLIVVGGGKELQSLQGLARELGIERSLVFTGHVDELEMVACLRAGDVYVSSSLSDSGTAASTAEAMACGLPVVSTDAGNIRERIHDGEGGYVVPIGDHKAIAEKVLLFLGCPDRCKLAGELNRRQMEQCYDVRAVIRQMEEGYSRLVAQRRRQ